MKNFMIENKFEKLIQVVGLCRGGTNIVWNIIQSHPEIIGTGYELNEIIGKRSGISFVEKSLLEFSALSGRNNLSANKILKNRIERGGYFNEFRNT